jgi:glutamate 5-kinase
MIERQQLQKTRRWIVKIGSALITANGQGLDKVAIGHWVQQIVRLRQLGVELVLVSSGSVAEGTTRLGFKNRPETTEQIQAAAAVGQMGLIYAYTNCFKAYQLATAQVLLTHDDLANRKRYLNARNTLLTLLKLNVIPIINENDTVVTDEIQLGDNDTLGALVTNLIEADVLVILTDQAGLYSEDPRYNPHAQLVSEAYAGDAKLEAMAGAGGALGRGGMITKLQAARTAARSGAVTLIANGQEPDILVRLRRGEKCGTLLAANQQPVTARKRWLAGQLQAKGQLVLDKGAVSALKQGNSLLAVGVCGSTGTFNRGDMVVCQDQSGKEIARGLVNYSCQETARIMGHPSQQIADILGYIHEHELIHRDNLVLVG